MIKKSLPFWGMVSAVGVSLIALFLSYAPQPQRMAPASGLRVVKSRPAQTVVVDVEGAIEKPGVYELPKGARLIDALVKAGGLSDSADRAFIAKEMNLATSLTNEEKIYVPTYPAAAGSEGQAYDELVHVNTASKTQLELLPRVGAVTAQKIIDNRPYGSLTDLVTKRVLSPAAFTEIAGLIVL